MKSSKADVPRISNTVSGKCVGIVRRQQKRGPAAQESERQRWKAA